MAFSSWFAQIDVLRLAFIFFFFQNSWGFICTFVDCYRFLRWYSYKDSPTNGGDTRDVGLILRSGRSPREGNDTSLQYSCLENSTDRGAWRAAGHRVLDTTECVRAHTHTHTHTDCYILCIYFTKEQKKKTKNRCKLHIEWLLFYWIYTQLKKI